MLREALRRMGRADLIGNGKQQLVSAWQPANTGARRRKLPGAVRAPRFRTQHTAGLPHTPKAVGKAKRPGRAGSMTGPADLGAARAARWILVMGGAFMALATIRGALGAHALLRPTQPRRRLEICTTPAVRFQFFQALGLLVLGTVAMRGGYSDRLRAAAWLLVAAQHRGPSAAACTCWPSTSPWAAPLVVGLDHAFGRHSPDRRVGDVCRDPPGAYGARLECGSAPAIRTVPNIETVLPELTAKLASASAVVLQAPPGAGKSTVRGIRRWCCWSVCGLAVGASFMLESPRRRSYGVRAVAAGAWRSTLGEEVGRTVGHRMRHGHAGSRADTRIEVVTEGVLTRMLQQDAALEGVGLVIFDEFHERSPVGRPIWGSRFTLDLPRRIWRRI